MPFSEAENSRYGRSRLGSMLTPVWPDRDNFIWLTSENIAQTNKNDFKKRPFGNARSRTPGSVDTKDTPYDVRSATV